MKSVILVMLLTVSSAFSFASTLELSAPRSLVSIGDGKIRLAIKENGSIEMITGRTMPLPVKITGFKDSRPVDGNLEISLSNGLKLVQSSGYSIEGIQRIYIIDSSGQETEMMPEVSLFVK